MAYDPVIGSIAAWIQSDSSSVIGVSQGSVAVAIVSGSIAASFTPPANQSVSGSVGIVGNPSISGTVLVNNGSVVAFQGTAPWIIGSIYGNISGSVAAFLAGSTNASVITVGTAVPNQSVSGTVQISGNPSISGTVLVNNGSVVAFQGTTPWTISSIYGNVSGSIAGTYTSSTVATTVTGLAIMFKPNVSSSIITEVSPTWPLPITGAIAASISGTVATTLSGNPSISGTVTVAALQGASISGTVNITGNPSISGTVLATQNTTPWLIGSIYGNISGSVAAFVVGNASVITVAQSSVAVAIISGSVALSAPANQSVSGTVGSSIIGTVPVVQSGTNITSIVSTVPSSVIVGSSMFGQLPAGTAMIGSVVAYQGAIPWTISSIYGNISGSVVATQGTSPWVVNFQNSSIIAVQSGSVISINQGSIATVQIGQSGTVMTSIAGTYATGAASIVSGLGVQMLGLRNDLLASIYGANATYSPITIGPAGEQIVSIAPLNQQVTGIASCFTGVEQPILASVAGNYLYVTGVQIANASANNVYLSFYGSGLGSVTGSIIGFTVAPANGGSNIIYEIPLKTSVSQPFSASISGVASIFLSAQGFYAKT